MKILTVISAVVIGSVFFGAIILACLYLAWGEKE